MVVVYFSGQLRIMLRPSLNLSSKAGVGVHRRKTILTDSEGALSACTARATMPGRRAWNDALGEGHYAPCGLAPLKGVIGLVDLLQGIRASEERVQLEFSCHVQINQCGDVDPRSGRAID